MEVRGWPPNVIEELTLVQALVFAGRARTPAHGPLHTGNSTEQQRQNVLQQSRERKQQQQDAARFIRAALFGDQDGGIG